MTSTLAIMALILGVALWGVNLALIRRTFTFNYFENVAIVACLFMGYGMVQYLNLSDTLIVLFIILAVSAFFKGFALDLFKGYGKWIALIIVVRLLWIEPFFVPTSSMEPTVPANSARSFLLVQKYTYGWRIPFVNTRLSGQPGEGVKRGDMAVFQYPVDPKINYVKRVIGLPGDTISYDNIQKTLTINGTPITRTKTNETAEYVEYTEHLMGVDHPVRIYPETMNESRANFLASLALEQNQYPGCSATAQQITCKVPAGHFFMMGDNRDNSADSRYWGYVTDNQMVGPAHRVW